MHKTKNVLFLALGFMIIGLVAIFFSHEAPQKTEAFVMAEDYAEHIKPWMEEVYVDPSLVCIAKVKQNLVDFKGSDKSIGPAHIALFMAFDTWEKYLLTGQAINKDHAVKHFSTAATLLPDIDYQIQNLKNILNQQNV